MAASSESFFITIVTLVRCFTALNYKFIAFQMIIEKYCFKIKDKLKNFYKISLKKGKEPFTVQNLAKSE